MKPKPPRATSARTALQWGTLAALVLSATLAWADGASAGPQSAPPTAPMSHLWLLFGGLAAAALGLVGGRVFRLPQPPGAELSWLGRVRRAAGATLGGVGLYVALVGLMPPVDDSDWIADFEEGRAHAREHDSPIIMDCWAEWCAACKEIFRETLQHPDVRPRLADFTRIKLDMDLPANEPLYDRFGFSNLPWVAVFDSLADLEAEKPRPRFVIREKIGAEELLRRLDSGEIGEGVPSVAQWLSEKGLLLTLALVFLGGLALSFTPCVLPVYILTVNVIGARRASSVWGRLGLSSVYVLGLAVTYTVLGVVAGLTGMSMGAAFRDPRILGGLALLFFVLALFYLEILRFPQAGGLSARIGQATGNNVVLALLLGMAAGLIAAPCVGPLLVGILTYIGTQRDVWLGFCAVSADAESGRHFAGGVPRAVWGLRATEPLGRAASGSRRQIPCATWGWP
jgi:cytochrome c biogenesis protein CcdA